jgi:hypothetical protein
VDAPQDIPKSDFRGGTGQQVAALLAALAFDDLGRLQLDEDLDQVIRRYALGGSHFIDGAGAALLVMLREPENGAGRIIAFHRKFHARNGIVIRAFLNPRAVR